MSNWWKSWWYMVLGKHPPIRICFSTKHVALRCLLVDALLWYHVVLFQSRAIVARWNALALNLQGTEHGLAYIGLWVNNHVYYFMRCVITYQCSKLRKGHGWIFAFAWCDYSTMLQPWCWFGWSLLEKVVPIYSVGLGLPVLAARGSSQYKDVLPA